MGTVDLPYAQLEGRSLVVDGYRGEVITSPSKALRLRYREIIKEQEQLIAGLEALKKSLARPPTAIAFSCGLTRASCPT